MKKSVLSIVAIAFAAVSVFTSCDKNDDGYGQSGKPAVQTSTGTSTGTGSSTGSNTSSSSTSSQAASFHGKSFFIADSFAQYGTFKIQVSDGTKTAEYDLVAQGEHGQQTIIDEDDKDTITSTGYMLKVVLPTTNALKCKVTFVPNDKVNALTASDRFKGAWAVGVGEGNSSDVTFKYYTNAALKVPGDKFVGYCDKLASKMSN